MIKIEQIPYQSTWPIRLEVMYPNENLDFVRLENDADGIHFGLFYEDKLTGIVSLFQEENVYQFRKLAILDNVQKMGFGSKIMKHVIEFCKDKNATKLWCNSRVNAKDFYKRLGFHETETTFFKDGYDFVIMKLDF